MSIDNYSEIVRGARGPLKALPSAFPDAEAAEAAFLAWEPSPASPTPPSRSLTPLPSSASAFPSLGGDVDFRPRSLQVYEPLMLRSWAAATKGTHSPSKSSFASRNDYDGNDEEESNSITSPDSAPTTPAAEVTRNMTSPLRGRKREDVRVAPRPADASGTSLPPLPARTGSPSATLGPNAALWNEPKGADLVIRCRSREGGELYWKVHRRILVGMSEWMEKYMPPEAEDGSVVDWKFLGWDSGQLGAVLQYMYLEDFQGGVYDPNKPLDTGALVLNTVHFIAGTACLCRPLMDQAVDQIDDATEQIQEKLPLLRLANLDEFEISIRRALLIMYDEPDQWRVRALRIVMGKLMAVCFPLILQSQRWASTYQKWWGMMRVRVVADHKWLYQAGFCQKSDAILSGFEHMDVIWIKYRKEGWQPSDDLMFPEREVEDPPAPASAPPTPAGGKKKSRAIPIVNPSGNVTSIPGKPAAHFTGKGKSFPSGQPAAQAADEKGNDKGRTPGTNSTFEPAKYSQAKSTIAAIRGASPSMIQSVPDVEDPFIGSSNTAAGPSASDVLGSCGGQAHVSYQPHSVFAPPFFMRPPPTTASSLPVSPQRTQGARTFPTQALQPSAILPWLPDGPFYFAETSTGEPASSAPPSIASWSSSSADSAAPSVIEYSSSTSAAASSSDPQDSPTRRIAELKLAFDGPNDEPLVDEHATPRAPAGNRNNNGFKRAEEHTMLGATLSNDEDTPRAPVLGQHESSEAAAHQATTPTAVPANRKMKRGKKKA